MTQARKGRQVIFDIDATILHSAQQLSQVKSCRRDAIGADKAVTHRMCIDSYLFYARVRPFAAELLALTMKYCDVIFYTMGTKRYAMAILQKCFPQMTFVENRVFSADDHLGMLGIDMVTEENQVKITKSVWLLNLWLRQQDAIDPLQVDYQSAVIVDDRLDVWQKSADRAILIAVPPFMGNWHSFDRALQPLLLEFQSIFTNSSQQSTFFQRLFRTRSQEVKSPTLSLFAQWHNTAQARVLKGCHVWLYVLGLLDATPFILHGVEELAQMCHLLGAESVEIINEAKCTAALLTVHPPTHIVFGNHNVFTLSQHLFKRARSDLHLVHVSWLIHAWFFRSRLKEHKFIYSRPEFAFTNYKRDEVDGDEGKEEEFVLLWDEVQQLLAETSEDSSLYQWCMNNPKTVNSSHIVVNLLAEKSSKAPR